MPALIGDFLDPKFSVTARPPVPNLPPLLRSAQGAPDFDFEAM